MAIKLCKKNIILITLFSLYVIPLFPKHPSFTQEKEGVTLSIRQLSREEARKHFYSINELYTTRTYNRYRTLEFIITNKTNKEFLLDQSNIELPFEDPSIVKKKLSMNLTLLPLLTGTLTATLLICTLGLATIVSVVAGATVGITTMALNPKSMNKTTKINLQGSALDRIHPTIIPRYDQLKRIVFVNKKQLKNQFTVKLTGVSCPDSLSFFVKMA